MTTMDIYNRSEARHAANRPINWPLELPMLLSEWAAEKGVSNDFVGNIKLVAELARILALDQRKTMLDILERAYSEYRVLDSSFGYHPPTLDTYLLREVIGLPQARDRADQELQSRSGDELIRYKIKAVRDTFLWLGELMEPRSFWIDKLIPDSEPEAQEPAKTALSWLSRKETRELCEGSISARALTAEDESSLEDLWQLFDGNMWLPVRCAFCLARLDPERSWTDGWSRLYSTVRVFIRGTRIIETIRGYFFVLGEEDTQTVLRVTNRFRQEFGFEEEELEDHVLRFLLFEHEERCQDAWEVYTSKLRPDSDYEMTDAPA
ncbi:hypothetical protein BDW62DRAFT_197075 [Aspergillus aurantiobrunneus]